MDESVQPEEFGWGRQQELTREQGLFEKGGLEVDDETLRNTFKNISLIEKTTVPEHLPMVSSCWTFEGRSFERCCVPERCNCDSYVYIRDDNKIIFIVFRRKISK